MINRFTGRSRGFGFVEMSTQEEAEQAIVPLYETDLGGRILGVNEARPFEEKRPFRSDPPIDLEPNSTTQSFQAMFFQWPFIRMGNHTGA